MPKDLRNYLRRFDPPPCRQETRVFSGLGCRQSSFHDRLTIDSAVFGKLSGIAGTSLLKPVRIQPLEDHHSSAVEKSKGFETESIADIANNNSTICQHYPIPTSLPSDDINRGPTRYDQVRPSSLLHEEC
eukprot:scaffold4373_cov114-Cylindrotheca_fusiformis.AAC.1